MKSDQAQCGDISPQLHRLAEYLDRYLRFEHEDAIQNQELWRQALDKPVPEQGIGIDAVIDELGQVVIPNGSAIPRPGCTAFITTGAVNSGILASLAGAVAAPQRATIQAFNFLEELSLEWLATIFELPEIMKGVYSSGGSTANLVALGAARQWAFENIGLDPARQGVNKNCRIYATGAVHHTIQRSAGVLGLGREAVVTIDADKLGRMVPGKLEQQIVNDIEEGFLPVAVVGIAGTTGTGVIDPLQEIGEIAHQHNIWFHIDGAYGLPGILDPRVKPLYQGVSLADSIIVDPHKWLGAPVGVGVTFVRDRELLNRAFTQGYSDYLEGSFSTGDIQHSMDYSGIPYHDFGVELSSPSRGVVVWAMLSEIGKQGLSERICRHNDMARKLAQLANEADELEVLLEPTLSICCFRYVDSQCQDMNELNRKIYRQLVHNNTNIPSTIMIDDKLAIRPCFIGARTVDSHVDSLVDEVIKIGREISRHMKEKAVS